MTYAILANCHIHSMRVYISRDRLYHGLFELKSGFTPYFSGFCEGMFSGFRYRFFVLPHYIIVSEIKDICFAKCEYNGTTIIICVSVVRALLA